MYFAIEGIDGSGKSTLLKGLQKEFKDAKFVREPGSSDFAEEIRKTIFKHFDNLKPMTIQLGMLTARSDLKQYVENEEFVISDRCFLSACYCEELKTKKDISDWIKLTKKYSTIPDLVIYLDITANECIKRLSNRKDKEGYDTLDRETIEARIKAYENWIDVAKGFYIRFVKINANKSIEEVTNEVTNLIETNRENKQCQRKASS